MVGDRSPRRGGRRRGWSLRLHPLHRGVGTTASDPGHTFGDVDPKRNDKLGPGDRRIRRDLEESSDSVVGYRVKEVLFGQSNVAVGRTTSISGSMKVSGTTVTAATFAVDMTTVASDQSRRDGQFNGRIMETSTYPTATFTLTQPIELGSIPAQGTKQTYQATGNLTLHGVTKTVTFNVTGLYTGSTTQVAGSIPITFADWNIPNPSFGPVSTEDHGVLEFALIFSPA